MLTNSALSSGSVYQHIYDPEISVLHLLPQPLAHGDFSCEKDALIVHELMIIIFDHIICCMMEWVGLNMFRVACMTSSASAQDELTSVSLAIAMKANN